MTTIAMADAIYVSNLPAGYQAYGGYVAGGWPTYDAMCTAFPDALHLSISPFASVQADALDIEKGDATIAQAPGWFKAWSPVGKNTPLPVFYTSASNVQALINEMTNAGIPRSAYLIWSAHYQYGLHICGPDSCKFPAVDGTQWDSPGPFDGSLLNDYFFNQGDPVTQQDIDNIVAALTPLIPTPAQIAAACQTAVGEWLAAEMLPNAEIETRVQAAVVAALKANPVTVPAVSLKGETATATLTFQ